MAAVHALVTDTISGRSAADIAQQRLHSWQLLAACQQGLTERLLEPGQKILNRALFIAMAQRWLDAASLTVRQITQAQWDNTGMDHSIQSQLTGLSEQLNLMTNWPQPNLESN